MYYISVSHASVFFFFEPMNVQRFRFFFLYLSPQNNNSTEVLRKNSHLSKENMANIAMKLKTKETHGKMHHTKSLKSQWLLKRRRLNKNPFFKYQVKHEGISQFTFFFFRSRLVDAEPHYTFTFWIRIFVTIRFEKWHRMSKVIVY